MHTPHRKPLRPVNRNTPSSAPHPTTAASTSITKPTRSIKPSRIPSLTPHRKQRNQPRPAGHENVPHEAMALAGEAAGGAVSGGRRVRRQVMKLSELMAAVRMTPIKEREEEDGLGEAEVAVDCGGTDNEARKQAVEQQEEEIRQYEAMLREEEEERRHTVETDTAAQSDFHCASELELELTQLQQCDVCDEDRRSSFFAPLPLPTLAEWTDSDHDARVTIQKPLSAHEESTYGPLPSTQEPPHDVDGRVDNSEIELQKPSKLHSPSDQQLEEVYIAPLPDTDDIDELSAHDSDDNNTADERLTEHQLDEAETCELLQLQTESQHGDRTTTGGSMSVDNEDASNFTGVLDVVRAFELSLLDLSSDPQDTNDVDVIYISELLDERAWQHEQIAEERAEKERETNARLQKEEDDYKSLYFAYCQLERDYNALKATLPSQPTHDQADCEDDEQQVAVCVDDVIDYAAMSEEKIVPSPQPALLDQLSAELQQLRVDKAEAEAQVDARVAAAETEAKQVSYRYEQLALDYTAQSDRLADALRATEDSTLAHAQLNVTYQSRLTEKDEHIQALNDRVLSLDTDNQRLQGDLHARQQQLVAIETQLSDSEAVRLRLTTDLHCRDTEMHQLTSQLSEQRETVEYAQNEKLALEQELSDLHTEHNTLLTQQTTEREQYESLLAQQRQKDADMLSVIDDSIANIEQLRTQLGNTRLAFDRCQHTLLEQWDEQLVRAEELYAVRLEVQQTSVELSTEAERVVAMAAQLTEADGMRAALESKLRCSEDRVEELTALMATVEQDRRKDKLTHSTLAAQLTEADRLLEEQKQKQRELNKHVRLTEDRAVRLEGDVAMHEQKCVRLHSELQRERDERRREVERRRETEAALDALQQHAATLEGQQEALTQSISLRPLGVTAPVADEYERRLRDKETLILRLGKTVRQMHRHIEVDVAQREAESARIIRQMQRVFVLVVKILSKPQYATDNDVRRLLEVLDRESTAVKSIEAKEEVEETAT